MKKNVIKIFGVGAAFLMILLVFVPVTYSKQITSDIRNESIDFNQDEIEKYVEKLITRIDVCIDSDKIEKETENINNILTDKSKDVDQKNPTLFRLPDRLGWKLDFAKYRRAVLANLLSVPVLTAFVFVVPLSAIVALSAFFVALASEDPEAIILAAAGVIAAILVLIDVIKNPYIIDALQRLHDSIDDLIYFLDSEPWMAPITLIIRVWGCISINELIITLPNGNKKSISHDGSLLTETEHTIQPSELSGNPQKVLRCPVKVEGDKTNGRPKIGISNPLSSWAFAGGTIYYNILIL